MKDTFGNANVELVALADEAFGLRYDSCEARDILDHADWASHWPVVDADGKLTGDVVETADCDGYLNVDDLAMINRADLTTTQRHTIDEGCVQL